MTLKDDGDYENFNWTHSSMYFSSTAELMATRFRNTPDEEFVFPKNKNSKTLENSVESDKDNKSMNEVQNPEINEENFHSQQSILTMMRDILCKIPMSKSTSEKIMREIDSHMGSEYFVKIKEMVEQHRRDTKKPEENNLETTPNPRPHFDKSHRGNRNNNTRRNHRRKSDFAGNQLRAAPSDSRDTNYKNFEVFAPRGSYGGQKYRGNNYNRGYPENPSGNGNDRNNFQQ